jgi:hypothetical protein
LDPLLLRRSKQSYDDIFISGGPAQGLNFFDHLDYRKMFKARVFGMWFCPALRCTNHALPKAQESAIRIRNFSTALWNIRTSPLRLDATRMWRAGSQLVWYDSAFVFRSFATTRPESPYDLLGINRNATPKEIKLAYYREAKKWHPDMNPNNPAAKERFQRITSAYELLMDDRRRSEFDRTGQASSRSSGSSPGSQQYSQQQYSSQQQQHAEDVFRSVQQDLEILLSAFRSYSEDLQVC